MSSENNQCIKFGDLGKLEVIEVEEIQEEDTEDYIITAFAI